MSKVMKLIPELRFPEFQIERDWEYLNGNELFETISNKNHNSDLPILAITQEQGAVPRELINYNVSVSDKSVESYKVVEVGDFIISLRSFQGGIEYSKYLGLCSPAYIILRKKQNDSNNFYRHFFKSFLFIQDLNRNLEGIRDGKMISYKQFSDILIPHPKKQEQQKIASCLSSLDELIAAHSDKLDALKDHKKGLMQNLFPQEGDASTGSALPKVRFPEFESDGEWEIKSIEENIDLISGIALKSKELSDDKSGTPILRGINITEGVIRHSDEMDKFFLGDKSELKKYLVEENDIVIGMDGSKVGKNVALISKEDSGSILIQRVARIKAVNSDVNYLYQQFVSYRFRRYVDVVNTSSGIPHISAKQIRDFEIGFPPKIEEQQKIASCLSALDELITAQTEKIEELQQHKKGLMQGLFPRSITN
ncbi:restriction endonuclease subunit S [Membranihabitans marinus]|uniref:restriction endonuclease subunit S n=1 Tax=Membranihabitans marinus TaxID=1227546 RepID=UPI001F2BC71C|nr:restriction endonuclease subunit S [Membranihabitans marinus]